jgi:hypothetical protein
MRRGVLSGLALGGVRPDGVRAFYASGFGRVNRGEPDDDPIGSKGGLVAIGDVGADFLLAICSGGGAGLSSGCGAR